MSGRNLLAGQMVYEMKITISTVDNITMKLGNVLNNLPDVNAYVVTRGLTKHKKKYQYSQQTGEFLKYTSSLIRTFTGKIIVLSFFFNISCKMHISPPLDDCDSDERDISSYIATPCMWCHDAAARTGKIRHH
jgi:hypothetical protein